MQSWASAEQFALAVLHSPTMPTIHLDLHRHHVLLQNQCGWPVLAHYARLLLALCPPQPRIQSV